MPCPFLGADRKWPARRQNGAIDPGRDIESERQLLLSIRLPHVAIEKSEGSFNRIRSYFGIMSVHNTLTVRGCLGEVGPNVPAMCRVFVNHQLDWSSFILLHLEPR